MEGIEPEREAIVELPTKPHGPHVDEEPHAAGAIEQRVEEEHRGADRESGAHEAIGVAELASQPDAQGAGDDAGPRLGPDPQRLLDVEEGAPARGELRAAAHRPAEAQANERAPDARVEEAPVGLRREPGGDGEERDEDQERHERTLSCQRW